MDTAAVEGRLFTYGDDPMRRMSVFLTGTQKRCIVVLGGQSDGFFSLLFIRALIAQSESMGWSVAQVQLGSACWGYGGRSHDGDAEDVEKLLERLNHEHSMSEICLLAWSTGVQIALSLMTKPIAEVITRLIFHGVVDDATNAFFSAASQKERVRQALQLVDEGKRDQLVAPALYDLPISAARLSTGGFPTVQEAIWAPALNPKGADPDHLTNLFQSLRAPLMLMIASHPEYKMTAETRANFNQAIATVASDAAVEYFNDTCDEQRRMLRGTEVKHVAAIVTFLRDQDAKREQREEQSRLNAAESLRRSRSILARSAF